MAMIRGFTLVGTLMAMAIVAILAGAYLTGGYGLLGTSGQRPDGEGHTVIGASAARARDEVCMTQLRQARQALEMASIDEDAAPGTLADLQGLPPKMLRCPIGQEEYSYDPSTRKVSCPHPGHENY